MGSFATNYCGRGSYRETAGCIDSSFGLRDYAGRFFLPPADRSDDRDLLPPEEVESERDRSALAQLLASVAPEQAHSLAVLLLNEFGSIGRMLCVSEEALRRVAGANEAVVKLLTATEKVLLAQLRNQMPQKLISTTDQKLIKYLQGSMGPRSTEMMRVLFLDNAKYLISDQELGTGSPKRLFVQPRSILKRALELDASGIILVHNHPGGDTIPSKSDVKFTMSIKMLCNELDISLHDHIIISSNHWSSFRKIKLL